MIDPLPTISLWEPWASLWAAGIKGVETRSWRLYGTLPRQLIVHAGKHLDAQTVDLCQREPFASALRSMGYARLQEMPLGCIVGVVTVTRVFRVGSPADVPAAPERHYGDYSYGRFGWVAESAKLLAVPIPAAGAQKIFGWRPAGPLVFADGVPVAAEPKVAAVVEVPRYPNSDRGTALRTMRLGKNITFRQACLMSGLRASEYSGLENGRYTLSDEDWLTIVGTIAHA